MLIGIIYSDWGVKQSVNSAVEQHWKRLSTLLEFDTGQEGRRRNN